MHWYRFQKICKKTHEELEIRGGIETIQTTVLLKSARIIRRVQETWENLQRQRT